MITLLPPRAHARFLSRYSIMHCSVYALALMYSNCCFSRRISNALRYMIFKLFLQACIKRISEQERGGPKRIWADGECYLTWECSPLWQPLPTASNDATMAGVPTLIDAFYRAVTYSQGGKAFYCLVLCGRWFCCAPMLGILMIFPPMLYFTVRPARSRLLIGLGLVIFLAEFAQDAPTVRHVTKQILITLK